MMDVTSAKAATAPQPKKDYTGIAYCVVLSGPLPSSHKWPGEVEITLTELRKLQLPLDTLATIAFCSVGYTSSLEQSQRQPLRVCKTPDGYAVGLDYRSVPVATGKELIDALINGCIAMKWPTLAATITKEFKRTPTYI